MRDAQQNPLTVDVSAFLLSVHAVLMAVVTALTYKSLCLSDDDLEFMIVLVLKNGL